MNFKVNRHYSRIVTVLFFVGLFCCPVTGRGQGITIWITTSSDRITITTSDLLTRDTPIRARISSVEDNRVLCSNRLDFIPKDGTHVSTLTGLDADLWTPLHPHLYYLDLYTIEAGDTVVLHRERIGFRKIESRNGKIWLNGHPLFLRGIAINPPGRGIPEELERSRDFALDYVSFMKSINVNIIRIPDSETWYDVCDELGMMVFGGNYSGSVNGERPPKNYEDGIEWYKNTKFHPIIHHPSLVMYALTNEVPYRGSIAKKWIDFLSHAHRELKKWDDTRIYIGNAGYGYGQSGDICDLHRYWGWYYASPYTFLHIRNFEDIVFPGKVQPLTITECVGNYTGPDGRYNLTPNHKNPVSQLSWTGHAPQRVQQLLADQHQSWTIKEATELTRRLRRINGESSGVFPFTILFRNWHTAESFVDMDPKPATRQVKRSYQPVLVSWETWTPQVYAGSTIHPIAHIINDSEDFDAIIDNKLIVRLKDKATSVRFVDTIPVPDIGYYEIATEKVSVPLPGDLFTGDYLLEGILLSGGKEISRNHSKVFIAQKGYSGPDVIAEVPVYDPGGTTMHAFRMAGIPYRKVDWESDLELPGMLVIGKNAADNRLASHEEEIRKYISKGGRLLILSQDSLHQDHLNEIVPCQIGFPQMDLDDPRYPPPDRPACNGFNINPERPEHPVFSGISRSRLRVWSDYTSWDESQSLMPAIYPVTRGFILSDKADIGNTAILANYSVGLEGIALAEFFEGKGSVLVSGFDLINRIRIDPVAHRLLKNMVRYMQSDAHHEICVSIDEPVRWGEYGSENGLLTGIYSGFMINAKPALYGSYEDLNYNVDACGHGYAGAKWGWNNRAGKQYVPYGRRIFGPYFHRGFGGVPTPIDPDSETGKAFFRCSVAPETEVMSNLVWNPADEPVRVTVSVNGKKVQSTVFPGTYETIKVPVEGLHGMVRVEFEGDRRLVFLESSFH